MMTCCIVIVATILCWLISSLYPEEVEDFIPHVGEVPSGLPSFSLPSLEGITEVIPNGFMVSLMCFISSYAPAKKFAIVDRYDINAGTELTALGAANIIGSLFGAMPVQGGMSRTSLGYASGVKSQVAGLVAAVVAVGVLALLTPLMYWIPRCALAGIIITAATHLMDFHHARWLIAHSKRDAAVWLMAFMGTLVFGLLQGVFLSVMLSVTLMIYSIALPPSFAMGRLSNGQWRAIKYWPQSAKTIPGILVFGVNGPLIFANWEYVKDKLLKTEEKYAAYCSKPVEAVVIQLGGVPIVDATAVQGLEELAEEYSSRGVTLWFAGAQGSVRKIIDQVLVRRRIIDQTGGDGDFVGVERILADLVQHVEAVVKQILPGIDLPVKTQAAVIIQRWWRSQSEKVKEMDGEIQDTYVNVQWAVDESTVADMIRCESLQCISLDQHYPEPLTMGQYEHCLRRRQMGSIATTADLVRRNTAAQLQHLLDPTPPEDT
ncbi:hypothetical protein FOL46_003114 [Perkinsus olseni]|uniref:STAS domain-containing protein n=1 Tax=Perkinsus olseni TaxID=32597 RepID=A0A7J6M491_PEROL|nr:hypothetical protein FOL46_003114 [Perkinsus olseni]